MPKSDIDLTTVLAVYGALLSTSLLVWQIWKGKRRLRVQCRTGFVQDGMFWQGMGGPDQVIAIEIVNIGYRPVDIREVSLALSDRTKLFQRRDAVTDEPFYPRRLDQHGSTTVYFSYAKTEEALRKRPNAVLTSALVRDAEDKLYRVRLPEQLEEAGLAQRPWWRRLQW